MARLSNLKSALTAPPARLKPPPKIADQFYQSREWRQFVAETKRERGRHCERCGSTNRVIGDHINERKDGGADFDRSNIELLCISCHNRKTHAARAQRALGNT